jgi:hypothetical protein
MNVVALITWIITALGGFYMLGTWISRGGLRQQHAGITRFRAPLIFGHFLLAAVGLLVWIAYVIAGSKALAWTAFIILLPVALLGFAMFARWLTGYRARVPVAAMAGGPQHAADEAPVPAERHLPVAVVAAHGLFAATTIVLVLLTALGVG